MQNLPLNIMSLKKSRSQSGKRCSTWVTLPGFNNSNGRGTHVHANYSCGAWMLSVTSWKVISNAADVVGTNGWLNIHKKAASPAISIRVSGRPAANRKFIDQNFSCCTSTQSITVKVARKISHAPFADSAHQTSRVIHFLRCSFALRFTLPVDYCTPTPGTGRVNS